MSMVFFKIFFCNVVAVGVVVIVVGGGGVAGEGVRVVSRFWIFSCCLWSLISFYSSSSSSIFLLWSLYQFLKYLLLLLLMYMKSLFS